MCLCLFFFQAEDGIRDIGVTGVQTCALPISIYLCTADADGMMVSFIQSNYEGFGSGVVVPGTGIALQNRGACFTLEQNHPNQGAGGKRPYHTIIPAFLTRTGTDGREAPAMAFGVMGGFMQPQ